MMKRLFTFILITIFSNSIFSQTNYEKGKKYFDEKNYIIATNYFQQGAEEGDANAQYFLVLCYFHGWGV